MIALFHGLSALCGRLSRARVQRLGAAIGWCLGSLLRVRRGEVQAAIGRCFPDKTPADVRAVADGMYRHLGILLLETLRFGAIDPDRLGEDVEGDGIEQGLALLSQGRGLIVLTAHLGNFDLLAMAAGRHGAPLTVITKSLKPAALNAWWNETRGRFGVRLLPPRGSYRRCREVLKANGILGFVLDQNMKRKRGIFVDFFGRPACTSPGLAMLSAQNATPVLPAFITRLPDGRHRVRLGDPLPPPADTGDDAIRRATQAYTAIIERAVRAQPDQWIWLHRRWRTQPDAAAPAAADAQRR